jgi:sulfite exporter TauE/SafE
MSDLDTIIAFCTSGPARSGGLAGGLFLTGLAGSAVHCAPMCGGFVLGQVADRMARLPAARLCEWRRVTSGMLLPYHLGRLTTYAVLGAVAGSIARASPVFLVIAAVLLIALAAHRAPWLDRVPAAWGRLIGAATARLPRGAWAGEYLLGAALGFLPCGFLYAALTAAAASGSSAAGAAAMVAFGLGTVPALAVVGIAGHAAGRVFGKGIAVAAPVLLAVNAAMLLALAWQRSFL